MKRINLNKDYYFNEEEYNESDFISDSEIIKEDFSIGFGDTLTTRMLVPGTIVVKKEDYGERGIKQRPCCMVSYEFLKDNATVERFCNAVGFRLYTDYKVDDFKKERIRTKLFDQNNVNNKINEYNKIIDNLKEGYKITIKDVNVIIEAYLTGKLKGINAEPDKFKSEIYAESISGLSYTVSDGWTTDANFVDDVCTIINNKYGTSSTFIKLHETTLSNNFEHLKYIVIDEQNIVKVGIKDEIVPTRNGFIYDGICKEKTDVIVDKSKLLGISPNFTSEEELGLWCLKLFADTCYSKISEKDIAKGNVPSKEDFIKLAEKTKYYKTMLYDNNSVYSTENASAFSILSIQSIYSIMLGLEGETEKE